MASSLYDHPDLYDLVAPADGEMIDFYVGVAQANGQAVLDLACGTGRISLPLAKAGLNVVGGDLSDTMLAEARASASGSTVAVEFVRLDMRDFELGRSFDTILIAANSMLHLQTADDFAGLLTCVRRHLRPGGQFVFDAFVPSAGLLSLPPGMRQLVGNFIHPTHGDLRLEETIHYDAIAQVSHVDWYWSDRQRPDFAYAT